MQGLAIQGLLSMKGKVGQANIGIQVLIQVGEKCMFQRT
jgi:hypothetical protein